MPDPAADSVTRWLKVWWHSLWRMFATPPHRMCTIRYVFFGRVDFCECGYPDGPNSPFVRRLKESLAVDGAK